MHKQPHKQRTGRKGKTGSSSAAGSGVGSAAGAGSGVDFPPPTVNMPMCLAAHLPSASPPSPPAAACCGASDSVAYPALVSLLTPTFNRRAFIPQLVDCVIAQSYVGPMEWVVADDGTDRVGELLGTYASALEARDVELRYVSLPKRMPLGRKRNMLADLARGEICLLLDDDDYHPASRVQHAVDVLITNPQVEVAGCSELIMLSLGGGESSGSGLGSASASPLTFHRIGPFRANHATCGTLAMRRSFFGRHRFADRAVNAEEEGLLDNFTVPLVQLRPESTLVCIVHDRNTVDKRGFVESLGPAQDPHLAHILSSSAWRFYHTLAQKGAKME